MDEQNRTAIIYDAQRKLLAANYEMAEIRSLLNELMALEEMEEVISLANSYIAEAELRISRQNLSEFDETVIDTDTAVDSDTAKPSVRRAEIKDIPGILDLLVQVDMVHHNGRPDLFKGPATKYNEWELKQILSDPGTPVFVCVEGEKVLGHAFCIHKQEINDNILTDIKTLYIDDICVDENARGKHIGKMLYEYVRSYAKENDYYNITLNVWTCNPGAMKFYESLGFLPQKIGMEMIL